ncbi:MAG TPA: hypothetical protein PLI95_05350 [Polyangiaceae bacterium]|nr:hypothetical protein [Polyangiaceae bacterium]
MLKVKLGKEVVVSMPNEIGALAQMLKVVADKGVDILAITTTVTGRTATVRMVTEDNLRVMDAFDERGFGPWESEVVIGELPHRPGTLRRVCEALSTRGIDLHHLYLTAGSDHNRCTIVFGSSNNERAVVFLNEVL